MIVMKKFLAGVVTGSLSTIAVMAMCDIITDMICFHNLEDDDNEDLDDVDSNSTSEEPLEEPEATVENENMETLPE